MVPDVVLVAGKDGETFALGDHFGMEEIRDDAVRLMAEWTLLDGTVKTVDIDFLLFENRTPITRTTFWATSTGAITPTCSFIVSFPGL